MNIEQLFVVIKIKKSAWGKDRYAVCAYFNKADLQYFTCFTTKNNIITVFEVSKQLIEYCEVYVKYTVDELEEILPDKGKLATLKNVTRELAKHTLKKYSRKRSKK